MYFPIVLICLGYASGQLVGTDNEERPVVPISILPYPFPNDNQAYNVLNVFQNLFANAGRPVQGPISTIRPPTNLLNILSGLLNRPLQSTTTGSPSSSTQNPSSSTVLPILVDTTTSGSGNVPANNNSTRAIFSTLPFNFSDAHYPVNPPAELFEEFFNQ